MITVKRTKALDKTMVLVKSTREIKDYYYHLATNNQHYKFKLNKYSIKDVDKFIKKNLIFIKQ